VFINSLLTNRQSFARKRCQARLNYDGVVTYQSVVRDLFMRMPDLEPIYRKRFSYLDGEELPYVVFGSFLVPELETALENRDTERIRAICAFLEEAAASASTDAGLEQLLLVEIGEWLGGTQREAEIAPSLGDQTKRLCRYVSGLATQRNSLKQTRRRR
jgi:hypothetical protein